MKLKRGEFNLLMAKKIREGMDKEEAYKQTCEEIKIIDENKVKKTGRPKKSFKEEFSEIKKDVTDKVMKLVFGV